MVSVALNLWLSLLAGLFAPLGALCVLPLYPAFITYLAAQRAHTKSTRQRLWLMTTLVVAGILASLFLVGLLFTFLLKTALTDTIAMISPLAFVMLALVSVLMIFGIDISRFFPRAHAPLTKHPHVSAFLFGLFFGIIVLPCNPAPLVVLFALSTTFTSFLANTLNFVAFGAGMTLPLVLLTALSARSGSKLIQFLGTHQKTINRLAGIIMLAVSFYYLFAVFAVFG